MGTYKHPTLHIHGKAKFDGIFGEKEGEKEEKGMILIIV